MSTFAISTFALIFAAMFGLYAVWVLLARQKDDVSSEMTPLERMQEQAAQRLAKLDETMSQARARDDERHARVVALLEKQCSLLEELVQHTRQSGGGSGRDA